ncbi:LAMI_0F02388g1_1 [Lachancea mirantina]|uniref:Protein YIF1 n=1 Tax=Lachancea mirantina TaxID=1230905 RepID=A0A1G4JWE3_9SACH|nr:LAMI_0F02388g1_1 [Lachancea mirantina]
MSYNPYAYAAENSDVNVSGRHVERQSSFAAPPQQHFAQQTQQTHRNEPFQGKSASMAYQLGHSAFTNFIGQENLDQFQEQISKAAGSSSSLSHYFQVSNGYVFRKLKIIVLPFMHRSWQRIPDAAGNGSGGVAFQTPRVDVNAPDLYIPVMGLITYILVCNVQQGLQGSFNPEDLYRKLSSTLAFVVLDLLILKLGLYLLVSSNSTTTPLWELICYVGYKFVPLTMALLWPTTPYYLFLLGKVYLFIAFGVFLLRSVKFNLFVDGVNDFQTVKKSVVKKCNYFLFVYGFLWQSVLMWLMG